MSIFKSYTFKWWEIAVLKVAVLLAGALIGAYWSDFFLSNALIFFIIIIMAVLYSVYAAFSQEK